MSLVHVGFSCALAYIYNFFYFIMIACVDRNGGFYMQYTTVYSTDL